MSRLVPLAFLVCCLCSVACGSTDGPTFAGRLALSLSAEAGGKFYRLSQGAIFLDGPTQRRVALDGSDALQVALPPGEYSLLLDEGWVLSEADGDALTPVEARLRSENPTRLAIAPGQTTQAFLRFELAEGTFVSTGEGRLLVGVQLGAGGEESQSAPCEGSLVINEVDYAQPGVDSAEFVEILNAGRCAAQLGPVTLELINGDHGEVYGRAALGEAGEALAPGGRVVVGTVSVIDGLDPAVGRVRLGSSGLQNGAPDGLRLVAGGRVLDAVAYGGPLASAMEGTPAPSDGGAGSVSRCPDGADVGDGARDFQLVPPTPGLPNACPATEAP